MALRPNLLKQKIREGGVALGYGYRSRDPEFVYHTGKAGADFAFIDLEHGPFDLETTIDLIWHSHAAGVTPLVRIPDLQYAYVTRLLDNGAQTLLVPHLKEPAEVQRLIQLAKYAPIGSRGMAMGGNAGTNFEATTDYVAGSTWANDNVCLGLNIETPEAVESLSEMLVPGIDFVIVGYGDLAQAYGVIGQHAHPRINAVMEETKTLCAERGIARMATPGNPDQIREQVEDGAQILLYGNTMGFVRAAVQRATSALEEITSSRTR